MADVGRAERESVTRWRRPLSLRGRLILSHSFVILLALALVLLISAAFIRRYEQLPRIFDRFTRFDRDQDTASGFGLGLTIVLEIVALHRGTLSVASQVGGGTTVTVRLPAAPAPESLQEERPGSGRAQPDIAGSRRAPADGSIRA